MQQRSLRPVPSIGRMLHFSKSLEIVRRQRLFILSALGKGVWLEGCPVGQQLWGPLRVGPAAVLLGKGRDTGELKPAQ